MADQFKDCFSKVSAGYAAHRPTYPPEMFDWLAAHSPRRVLAWDCACGSGQATLPLARHFERVVASDASRQQIEFAPGGSPNIEWRVAPAHQSGLDDSSVDLITVAQALHWFHLDAFYAEVRRALRPGGILAVWTYGLNEVEGEGLSEIVQDFYFNVVGPYWPFERKLVEDGYRTLSFPFHELPVPAFCMKTQWSLDQLLGYFRTWSATSRYIAQNGRDPVEALDARLSLVWGPREVPRVITWPLSVRAGRNAE